MLWEMNKIDFSFIKLYLNFLLKEMQFSEIL